MDLNGKSAHQQSHFQIHPKDSASHTKVALFIEAHGETTQMSTSKPIAKYGRQPGKRNTGY